MNFKHVKGFRCYMKNSYKYFKNFSCEYFPCHKCDDSADFNCLFCFCPLYSLGNSCGGDFIYLENGTKDCSECLIPHRGCNYDFIIQKLSEASKSNPILKTL